MRQRRPRHLQVRQSNLSGVMGSVSESGFDQGREIFWRGRASLDFTTGDRRAIPPIVAGNVGVSGRCNLDCRFRGNDVKHDQSNSHYSTRLYGSFRSIPGRLTQLGRRDRLMEVDRSRQPTLEPGVVLGSRALGKSLCLPLSVNVFLQHRYHPFRRFLEQPVPRAWDDDAINVLGDQARLLDQK